MSLVLDEHGSAAGMVTRLEAFVDMLTRQKQLARAAAQAASEPVLSLAPAPTPVEAPTAALAAAPATSETSPATPLASPITIAPPNFLREIHKPVLGFPRMGTVTIPLKSAFRGD